MRTPKKRSKRSGNRFLFDVRVCEVQAACDGAHILTDRGMCGACEKKLAKKNKPQPKYLKGESTTDKNYDKGVR